MIQVREYAVLTCDASVTASMDVGVVSPATFDWLVELQSAWKGQAELLSQQGRHRIRLCSFVGYLQSPTGEGIEILPKTERNPPQHIAPLRQLLQKMLSTAMHLKHREAEPAHLARMDTPLHEWIIGQFLLELSDLVRRGLRFDYQRVEEESRFIRGQLDMGRQSRQPPEKATQFHIRHDVFSPLRLENRLLRTALDYVRKVTRHDENWRMANILSHQMADIPPMANPLRELPKWQQGKLMQTYQRVKPWCELILEKLNPTFQAGLHRGVALLFPMEKLYEHYVTYHLRRRVRGAQFTAQASSQYLVKHCPAGAEVGGWFKLQPDVLLHGSSSAYHVLDAKWKLLNSRAGDSWTKYGIDQADLYQLFAYGHKYLNGVGHLMLVYPKHSGFEVPLPVFDFGKGLYLWCVPFDLVEGKLVAGGWQAHFSCLTSEGFLAI